MTKDHLPLGFARAEVLLEVTTEKGDGRYSMAGARFSTSEARSLAAALLHLADADELHRYDNR